MLKDRDKHLTIFRPCLTSGCQYAVLMGAEPVRASPLIPKCC